MLATRGARPFGHRALASSGAQAQGRQQAAQRRSTLPGEVDHRASDETRWVLSRKRCQVVSGQDVARGSDPHQFVDDLLVERARRQGGTGIGSLALRLVAERPGEDAGVVAVAEDLRTRNDIAAILR